MRTESSRCRYVPGSACAGGARASTAAATAATVVVAAGTTTTLASGTPAGCCSPPAVSAARSASSRSASRHLPCQVRPKGGYGRERCLCASAGTGYPLGGLLGG